MRSSWFVSLLVLLMAACVSIKPGNVTRDGKVTSDESVTQEVTRHASRVTADITLHASRVTFYKATLDIKKHHLTGLLIVKRMDSLATPPLAPPQTGRGGDFKIYRIVFANEIGMTFFDLELKSDSFRVISCFESLDKKALMKIFETDFRLLTGMDPERNERFYRQSGTNNLVISARAGKYKTWQTFSPSGDTLYKTAGKSTFADPVFISYLKYRDGFPVKITVENPFIGMKWSLRLLDRKN
jgi:hypothetical protein